MQERDLHDVLSDEISVHFIEAPKCDKLSIKNKNRLIRWMKYLSYSSPEEIVEMAKDDDVFTGVLEAEKMFVRNREEMLEYEARERYEIDMATIKADGIAEGRAEGRAEGKFDSLFATAKNLLKMGLSKDQVKQATNLSDKELAKLL